MTFDNELILVSKIDSENAIGDVVTVEEQTPILCGIKSVTRSEHYAAAAHGLRPEIVFIVNQYDYNHQKEVEFEGNRYVVIRSYLQDKAKSIDDFENLELICQGMMNDGG